MSHDSKTICVMGLGYIGLPTASILATKGYKVTGVDVSQRVVDTINEGRIHIVEPDLDILVKSAVNSGNLTASLQPVPADIFIIAVPTPFKDGKKPDLFLCECRNQGHRAVPEKGNLVILESTSPPGTTEEMVAAELAAAGHNVGEDIFIAHCPERVLPGRILIELIENDRVVGGINEASTLAAVEFYESFVRGEVLPTNAKTAELVKLTENSYRDVNIAFANEISMIADAEGINTWEVIALANRHPRVNILNPGPGVGGHCIAVDPWFIVDRSPQHSRLIRTAREVNDSKPEWVLNRLRVKAAKFREPVIGCLGLAFKADVDDLRESPAYEIVKHVQAEGIGKLMVCEPNLKEHRLFELHKLDVVLKEADILLVLVDHRQFRKLTAPLRKKW
ncbi:MAG: UDP-N-acetyl-D-mannosamine dehydrogenase [Gammaproteobacteria bacterium]|nr:UDP-N-acetyl-D-mannosamine dehydrogenase [Gammaproteobacteria bacterium]